MLRVCEGRELDVVFVLFALTEAPALSSSSGGTPPPAICHCLILSRTGAVSRSVRSNCFSGGKLEVGVSSWRGIGPAEMAEISGSIPNDKSGLCLDQSKQTYRRTRPSATKEEPDRHDTKEFRQKIMTRSLAIRTAFGC